MGVGSVAAQQSDAPRGDGGGGGGGDWIHGGMRVGRVMSYITVDQSDGGGASLITKS